MSSVNDIDNVKAQIVREIFKPARKKFPRRHVEVRGIDETFQADLIEFLPYARENDGHRYALTCIDIFSKFGFIEILKSKSAQNVSDAMRRIFETTGRVCKNMHTDQGSEFKGAFKQLMQEYSVNHYHTQSHLHASIVERFNKTIKIQLFKELHYHGSVRWIDFIHSVLNQYNYRVHSTIKMAPANVKKIHEKSLLETVYSRKYTLVPPKYKVGDCVRISKYKALFDRSFHPSWSTEIFKIARVRYTTPITYDLIDYQGDPVVGSFYEHEIAKTKYPDTYLIERVLKRVGPNRFLVRWVGFDSSHDSIVDGKDIFPD